ncbi:MAG: hypothetical protein ACI810_002578 [Gammaproteobacteria bacterium]|jgi:hypothetical protein
MKKLVLICLLLLSNSLIGQENKIVVPTIQLLLDDSISCNISETQCSPSCVDTLSDLANCVPVIATVQAGVRAAAV